MLWELIPNADFYYNIVIGVDMEAVRQNLPMFLMSTMMAILCLLYIHAQGNYYLARRRGIKLSDKEINEVIERVDKMSSDSGVSFIQVLLAPGTNAGAIAIQLQKALENRNYSVGRVDSLLLHPPLMGIKYVIYEGGEIHEQRCIRIILGNFE